MKKSATLMDSLKRDKRISVLRRTVQGGFALFCLYAGYRFYLFYLWASGQSDIYVPRPPSVEAFLPISALVNLKRLVLTGGFDDIHPAGLTIFMAALVMGLALRKGFCGWICPVGFASNLAESVGRKLKLLQKPPAWLDYPLLSLKYLLLFFFSYLILFQMDLAAMEAFNRSTYNLVVDAKMMFFFLAPSTLSLWILIFLVVISFFLRNFWCRYLCPYGGLLGLLALCSPLKIRRKEENCIDCKKCDRICPGAIQVSGKKSVSSPECIGCGECVSICPAKDCLSLTAPGPRKFPLVTLPAAVLTVFFLFYAWAILTGHWHNDISPDMMRDIYSTIDLHELAHP
ncbi:MAG: 4Fe-4S binding protein [Desulfobulbaceae bacterium]|nr:4Fe-4S binding protein [Desulfobulbaceae bacterium]